MAQTFLVTGAGGQLGRRVLEFLVQAKPGKLIATTRNPDKLAEFAQQGVEVRKADFGDAARADRCLQRRRPAAAGQHRRAGDAGQAAWPSIARRSRRRRRRA